MECATLASCSSEDSVVPFSSPCATPAMSIMGKRNCNHLLPNSRDKKVMEVSQVKQYYLKTKAIGEHVSNCLCFIPKARNDAAASWNIQSSNNFPFALTMMNRLVSIIITEGCYKHVFKTIYQQAWPELWHEKQVISGIMHRLGSGIIYQEDWHL